MNSQADEEKIRKQCLEDLKIIHDQEVAWILKERTRFKKEYGKGLFPFIYNPDYIIDINKKDETP